MEQQQRAGKVAAAGGVIEYSLGKIRAPYPSQQPLPAPFVGVPQFDGEGERLNRLLEREKQ